MKKLLLCFLILVSAHSLFGWANIATSFLKEREGFKSKVYICSAGKRTIGYGSRDPKLLKLGVISEELATNYLQRDVVLSGRAITSLIGDVQLTNNQLAALISLRYNIGETNFRNSTLLKYLKAGNLDKVPVEMLRWVYITDPKSKKKVVSKGLQSRRELEVALWNK